MKAWLQRRSHNLIFLTAAECHVGKGADTDARNPQRRDLIAICISKQCDESPYEEPLRVIIHRLNDRR